MLLLLLKKFPSISKIHHNLNRLSSLFFSSIKSFSLLDFPIPKAIFRGHKEIAFSIPVSSLLHRKESRISFEKKRLFRL